MELSLFEGKKILVTGAGGLIGRAVIAPLLKHRGALPIKVLACVRNIEKARRAFATLPQDNLEYIQCDVRDLPVEDMGVDYIVHGASRTASKDFVSEPVEVIASAVCGTKRVLEFARKNPVKGMVYLSTMEVYGAPTTDDKIYETSPACLDTMQARSSYPESKRLCETFCAAYAAEYGVRAMVVRLTQTFGEGVAYNDNRVFAEFARCVIEGRDIILKTKGETKRNYLYTEDAANAILTVLSKGVAGEAYNAANEDTYCSIYDMAVAVAKNFGGGKVRVIIDEAAELSNLGYAPTLKMNLSAEKLKSLGWTPRTGLLRAFEQTIEYMKKNRE